MISFQELVKAGVHFGHQTSRWCPQMAPFIWGFKNKVHLIDVSKTAYQLEKSAQFLKGVALNGKQVMWLGTKKSAQEIMRNAATKLDMPYVNHRWIGGTFSNNTQVKKSVTKLLHYEDVLERSEKFPHYTKKELNVIQKNQYRLEKSVGGIRNLVWPVGALVVVDITKEASAVREAVMMNIPVVALVDTNSDPSLVDYVIPANDDSPRSVSILIEYLAAAVEAGKNEAKQAAAKKAEERAEKIALAAAEKKSVSAKVERAAKPAAKAPAKKAEVKAEPASSVKKEAVKPAAKTVEKAVAPKKPAAKTEVKKTADK